MRPGPGLVVMALAFISGARRGTSQQHSSSAASSSNKLGKFEEDNTEALSRINPWLSACDLAQPNTAPDLQGQCSAGTLPVAWIDEGPGPPRCPPPCKASTSNSKNSSPKANNIDNTKYNMENRLNDKQQCLDYLGDNEELSPAQICKNSSQRSIETKLRALRLRHCCERTVGSALHNAALEAVLGGGSDCERMLGDLLETDSLAARITCEFTEVLVRYDCGQPYSIIHHCEDCREAYRRWSCSMLLPYFGTREDFVSRSRSGSGSGGSNFGTASGSSSTKSDFSSSSSGSGRGDKSVNNNPDRSEGDPRAAQGKSSANKYRGDASKKQTEPKLDDSQLVKNISIDVKSSRRKTQRVRIRPCLDVCQTVEQKCPYMLPGDRAPAYPTQYAGEPTFLCRDLNIEETGEQKLKSNSGRPDCCYEYCGTHPRTGVCSRCDPLQDEAEEDAAAQIRTAAATSNSSRTSNISSSSLSTSISISSSSSARDHFLDELRHSSELPPRLATCPSITSATTPSSQSGRCRTVQQQQQQQQGSTTESTPTTSTPTPRTALGSTRRPSSTAATTTTAADPAASVSSSAPSLAASSTLIKLTSIKSIYNNYFNNSWTMRLRWLDEFVAWTKILLQLAGL